MKLEVHDTSTIEQFMQSDEFKSFDEGCLEYLDAVYLEATRELNEYEREQFDLWWNGKMYVQSSEKVHFFVLWAMSQGAG